MMSRASMITSTTSGIKKERRMPSPKERTATLISLKRALLHILLPPNDGGGPPLIAVYARIARI